MPDERWNDVGNYFLKAYGIENFKAHEVADVGRERDGVVLRRPSPKLMLNAIDLIVDVLEWVREWDTTQPVIVNSFYRNREYNEVIGGASSSLHLEAAAADIRKKGYSPKDIALALHYEHPERDNLGVGLYSNWVHVDIRGYLGRAAPVRFSGTGIGNWWE